MKRALSTALPALLLSLLLCGCAYEQAFTKPDEIRSRARYVAVLPMVNLTAYPNAGRIVADLLLTELYAGTDFQIMEQTEMLEKVRGQALDLDEVLDKTVALTIGRSLGVDTVIYGSVTEYTYKRGLDEDPVVGINLRMLDVPAGEVLWAGSQSGSGGCFWFCEDSLNRLAQQTCHELVGTMMEGN